MSIREYVMVLLSAALSLARTELASGVADLGRLARRGYGAGAWLQAVAATAFLR